MASRQLYASVMCPAIRRFTGGPTVALCGRCVAAASGSRIVCAQETMHRRHFCAYELMQHAKTQVEADGTQKVNDVNINIVEPALGQKVCPHGTHPVKYLASLPALRGVNLKEDAEFSYVSPKTHSPINIQCEADWSAFLNAGQPELQVRVTRCRRLAGKVQQWCHTLFNGWTGGESEMAACIKKMEGAGYRNLSSSGFIWVERGYQKDAWKEVVDTLVENGLPGRFKKPLVLAAGATKGSSKSLQSNEFRDGERVLYHTKFRVMPGETPGTVDGFVALYSFTASAPKQSDTNIETEEAFKTYVELDAKRRWKDEAEALDLED